MVKQEAPQSVFRLGSSCAGRVTLLELWSLLKACKFQEKPWTVVAVNFGHSQLLVQQQLPAPCPSQTAGVFPQQPAH